MNSTPPAQTRDRGDDVEWLESCEEGDETVGTRERMLEIGKICIRV